MSIHAQTGDVGDAPVYCDDAGDWEIVAATPGKRIRVLGYVLLGEGEGHATWYSDESEKSGPMPLADGVPGGAVAPLDDAGWFDCAKGEALILTLAESFVVSGHVRYQLID